MESNPTVLRNKGVPIELYRLDEDGKVVVGEEGEAKRETVWVRFDANAIVDLEDAFDGYVGREEVPYVGADGRPVDGRFTVVQRPYYGTDGLEKAMEERPIRTLRTVLAIALGSTEKRVGAAMLPEMIPAYQTAFTAAWSMAQGVSPEAVGKLLEVARVQLARAAEEREKSTEEQMVKLMESLEATAPSSPDAGPGESGSQPGSETPSPAASDEPTPSSGA